LLAAKNTPKQTRKQTPSLAPWCRLKQQVQQAVQQAPTGASVFAAVTASGGDGGEAPQPQPPQQQQNGAEPQQYLRLPVESAKRLRWFDRQDLSLLMQARQRLLLCSFATHLTL
jgi:hypothetical protein